MPIVRNSPPVVAQRVPQEVAQKPMPQMDISGTLVESNERLAMVIREAVEANMKGSKVIDAKVIRSADGLIDRIRMTVESV